MTLVVIGTRGVPNQHGGFEALAEHLQRNCSGAYIDCEVIGNRDLDVSSTSTGKITSHGAFRIFETPLRTWAVRKRACGHQSALVVNPVNVLTAMWLQRDGKRVLLHMDGMEDQRKKWGYVAKRTHRAARYLAAKSNLTLVTDSRAIQDWYWHKYHKDSIFIPYGGCPVAEEDLFHSWSEERAGDYFLVVARPEPENQIYEICSAFLSSTSPWRLMVVGAPSHPTHYWKRVQRLIGDSQRVHLAGSIYDRDRLCELYTGCRGVIHGHTVGGTNPSLVDALSHGCPVFAHGNPYNKEVVGDSSPTWNSEADLRQFFSANQIPHSTVDVRDFISRYNWADVTQKYLRAFGLK
jgi:glycosyltransferase involved in cell wall biosynthesis